MGTAAFICQQCPLCHAEPMLFVGNDQRQSCKGDLFLKNGVRSHHQRHAAVRKRLIDLPALLGTDRPGQQSHRNAQRFQKLLHGVIMLHRQNFRRRHQCALHPVLRRKIARRRRNSRLAAAHVALQKPVHRDIAAKVCRDLFHGVFLPVCHGERQCRIIG